MADEHSISDHQISDNQISDFKVAALYHFVTLNDFEALRAPITEFCEARGIKGTLLLANEGINGTVAGSAEAIDELIAYF